MVGKKAVMSKKLLFIVNVDSFFLSHRLPLALAAQKEGFDVHIATTITDKKSVLEHYGINVHSLRLVRGGVGPINALLTIVDIWYIIKRIRPDIVHLVTIKPVLLGGLVARWLRVPALISAISGLGSVFIADGRLAKVQRWFVVKIYSLAFAHRNQVVIFQNSDDCNTLMSLTGLVPTKVEIVRGSGVDLSNFNVEPLPQGLPVVLFPARLIRDKGIDDFIGAVERLRSQGIVARFAVAGNLDVGNPTSISHQQLNKWVATGLIENWGFSKEMPKVLAKASIIVLPSFREGLPKVLQEAAACGRAVVTSDVPGCRDAIEDGVTGFLVPVRNPDKLAVAIKWLLLDLEKCRSMGIAGRRLAEREFDVRAIVVRHLSIYQKIIS
jgi:glycosyltransferase involved in cell wall biosynthesis